MHVLQPSQTSVAPPALSSREKQLQHIEYLQTSREKQERLNQAQRKAKLSLIKSTLKKKPTISAVSSLLAGSRYLDLHSGRKLNSAAKIEVLSTQMHKNSGRFIRVKQQELESAQGIFFSPSINDSSRRMQRSVDSLIEWKEQVEQKTQSKRDLKEQDEKKQMRLSLTKLTSPGSEAILQNSQRNLLKTSS